MRNNFLGEIVISLALIGILVFFINPFSLLMPQPLHPFMAPFLAVLFIIFTGNNPIKLLPHALPMLLL